MKVKLNIPISEEEIRKLNVGDEVYLTGIMVTARDAAHKLMHEEKPDFVRKYLENGVIYHCGPVIKKENGEYKFVAAGPTTSIREEPYEAEVMCEYKVRGVIGKGGMRDRTIEGLKKCGGVYFHAVGGAGSLIASKVKRVVEVFKLEEFGTPEAFWVIEVEDFPVIVTMDSKGNSLHDKVLEESKNVYEDLISK